MIFDQAASIIERHIPAVLKRVEQSRIFLFDARAQDVLPKHSDAETVEFLHEHFFLPFPFRIRHSSANAFYWKENHPAYSPCPKDVGFMIAVKTPKLPARLSHRRSRTRVAGTLSPVLID